MGTEPSPREEDTTADEQIRNEEIEVSDEWAQKKDDEIYAPWEELIKGMLKNDPTNLEGLDPEVATTNLAEEVDDIKGKQHAKAIIETLQEKNIIQEEKDHKLVLLPEISVYPNNNLHLYNWAALFQYIRDKINKLLGHIEDIEDNWDAEDFWDAEDPGRNIEVLHTLRNCFSRYEKQFRTMAKTGGLRPKNPEEPKISFILEMLENFDTNIQDMDPDEIQVTITGLVDSGVPDPNDRIDHIRRNEMTPEEIEETLNELVDRKEAEDYETSSE